jgi:predicted Zn-dependent protease
VLGRVAVAVIAVLVLGWLGVMERDRVLRQHGVAAAGALHRPGAFAAAERDFRAARLLSPDTAPDVSRAFLYAAAGQPRRAVALLDGVLRREPDNLAAWGALFSFARQTDPAAARRALAARRRLDPVDARR